MSRSNVLVFVQDLTDLPVDLIEYVVVAAPFHHDYVCIDKETGLLWTQESMHPVSGVVSVSIDELLGEL